MTFKPHLILVFMLYTICGYSQIGIDNSIDEESAVNDILLGTGVTASNITFSGDNNQIGSFDSNGSNMVISSGVILATGNCNMASSSMDDTPGPGGNNQQGMTVGGNNFGAGDSDLQSLSGQSLNDAAILEFDFVPQGDSLSFSFIFASEEYTEFVNSGVNDAFGFFLSGPGITGTFENNAVNIAVIPGTNTPISIDDVNNINNSEYYIDNETITSDPDILEYDGFTTLLTAEAEVQCGETYHIKLVIADGGDSSLDSAVFLEASSFSSNQISVDLVSDVGFLANDSTAYEGCSTPVINITRTEGLDAGQTIDLQISGTAEIGTDYTGIQEELTFNPGQSEVQISIDIVEDNIDEPLEFITITFESVNSCSSETSSQELTIYILDVPEISIQTEPQETECQSPLLISPEVTGGAGELSILWDDGSTEFERTVNPTSSTTYEFTITDECDRSETGSILVEVPIYGDIIIEEIPGLEDVSCGDFIQFTGEASGGNNDLTYNWYEGTNLIHNGQTLEHTIQSSSLSLVVTDGCSSSSELDLQFTFEPISISAEDIEICLGETGTLEAQITSGEGTITVNWPGLGLEENPVYVTPETSTTYTVQAYDNCGTTVSRTVNVDVYDVQASILVFDSDPEQLEFINNSSEGTNVEWNIGNYLTSTQDTVLFTNPNPYVELMVTLYAETTNGCKDSTSLIIEPQPTVYVPNSFTPDNDGYNDTWSIVSNGLRFYHLIIFNRDGEIIFESKDENESWNGSVNNGEYYAPDGIYTYTLLYRAISSTEAKELKGHITLLR